MSKEKGISLWGDSVECDLCGAGISINTQHRESWDLVVKAARALGWVVVKEFAVCPECQPVVKTMAGAIKS